MSDEQFKAVINRRGSEPELLYGKNKTTLTARAVKRLNQVAWSTIPVNVIVYRRTRVVSRNESHWEIVDSVAATPQKT